MQKPHALQLTRREKEVLIWAAVGKTAMETGQLLLISRDTVNFHIKNCLRKLDVENKTAAAAKATALGLLKATEGSSRSDASGLDHPRRAAAALLSNPFKLRRPGSSPEAEPPEK